MKPSEWHRFEEEKQRIAQKKLSAAEYEKAIKALCKKFQI